MQVDFKTNIRNIDGALITQEDGESKNALLTLSRVCVNALLSRFSDEQGITGEEMVDRFNLALRIKDQPDGSVEINPEELVLIRKLIAKGNGPLICGRAWKLLEGTNAPSE